MPHTYIDHPVHDRLYFAERRLNDLRALNGGNIAGAPHRERQPLLQEFFFHLCGAIDFLAQEVNEVRKLGLDQEKVDVQRVRKELDSAGPINCLLGQLHPNTRNKALPADPYSEEGSHFRIMVVRHFVSHIRHSPLSIQVYVGSSRASSATLFLDPRLPHVPQDQRTQSKREVFEELTLFLELVTAKCNLVLRDLGIPVS
jgi:hypothetical protein